MTMLSRCAGILHVVAILFLATPSFGQQTPVEQDTTSEAKVWVNTSSHVYHCPNSRYYGNTKAGRYMLESKARESGNRPAYGQACSPLKLSAKKEADDGITVWVNTNSGVYHCKGTQWYGRTKSGKYLSQTEARSRGYRPAYGRVCK